MILAAQLGGPLVSFGTYLVLAVWALLGMRQALEALTVNWLLAFLNPGIFGAGSGEDMLRWIVICAAFIRVLTVFFFTSRPVPRSWIALVLFVVIGIVGSTLASYALDVSILKLVMFFAGSSTILLAFHATRDLAPYWRTWFAALYAVVVVVGFPLLFFPLGYVRNGSGFQGILSHPQAYALFLAPFVARYTASLVLRSETSPGMLAVLVLGWISLLATRARTGLVAIVLGLAATLLLAALFRAEVRRELKRAMMRPLTLAVLSLAGGGLVLNADVLQKEAYAFLMKGDEDMSVTEAFQDSRGGLIARSWSNFKENPVFGIGFGVASDPISFQVRRDPVFGLPVGASVEKGFVLTAILEEMGVVGTAFFILMLFMILRPLLRRSPLPVVWAAMTALSVNIGESVFFAVGGMGLFMWFMIGYAGVEG